MSVDQQVISRDSIATSDEFNPQVDFAAILQVVSDALAPVWPLQDYVAVNPYFGISDRSFLNARSFLRVFSDCETLMPLPYYAAQFRRDAFRADDIADAITQMDWPPSIAPLSVSEIIAALQAVETQSFTAEQGVSQSQADRPLRTLAELASERSSLDWSDIIRDEIAKFCAAHFDDGQASWASPWKSLSLYQAWQSAASLDRNLELLGLHGLRQLVSHLPATPEAALVELLNRLDVPQKLWSTILLNQAFSIPGWCAWAKYQDESSDGQRSALAGLLAMRLAYEVAVGNTFELQVDWQAMVSRAAAGISSSAPDEIRDVWTRFTLLRASEIHYQKQVLGSLRPGAHAEQGTFTTRPCLKRGLPLSGEPGEALEIDSSPKGQPPFRSEPRPAAQICFCIDVRSERIRRQLESVWDEIETLGFAGFFAMPLQYASLGEAQATDQLPVLLRPKFRVIEGIPDVAESSEKAVVKRRVEIRSWRKQWRSFQTSAVGCFAFVEMTGLLASFKLLGRLLAIDQQAFHHRRDGLKRGSTNSPSPTLRGLSQQELTTPQLAQLVATMLKNMGLTGNFAKLVVLCGHASQCENNPLSASLECGACGGHSGEPNARFAALLLNQYSIREALKEFGILIPEDTHFLAAVHNTTTDEIDFCDRENIPTTHRGAFEQLQAATKQATRNTQRERQPLLRSLTTSDLLRRARDWSEVRPEWGLAGNAAMIVGPRSLTKDVDLKGNVFLHNYDYTLDHFGTVLETIMTAPMIVANWINMQYYASTVDPGHFGSGNKTLHNVVGRFGILSGNAGDLKTGLPWQSVHNGNDYQHRPLRLLVIIAAPRAAIDNIIAKHAMVSNLATNGWLNLVAIDSDGCFSYGANANWQKIQR